MSFSFLYQNSSYIPYRTLALKINSYKSGIISSCMEEKISYSSPRFSGWA